MLNCKKTLLSLDITYKDKDKDMVIPILNKIAKKYQEYSGKDKRRKILLTKQYLNNQIGFFKESFNSLKKAQEFAIDQDLIYFETKSQLDAERQFREQKNIFT